MPNYTKTLNLEKPLRGEFYSIEKHNENSDKIDFAIEKITVPTIEHLQGMVELKIGDVVEIQGYYEAGDGAHHKRKIEATDDGSGVPLANGLWANVVHDGEVNVSWFGAKGDGVTDDRESFRKAIKFIYVSSESQTGWRDEGTILLNRRTYFISGSIIDGQLYVSAGRFKFKGTGQHSTRIDFRGTLFDNTGVFGFTHFEGIEFISDNNGLFMNYQGGGSGNAQGLNFNQCRFRMMHCVIKTSGTTMSSEVTFNQCRLSSFDENSKIFVINNPQGVNWRFVATDIENFSGVCFELLSGFACSVFHGSIIPLNNAVVVSVPLEANSNLFGPNNSPDITFYSSRFELRDTAKLVKKNNYNAGLDVHFYSCGMGGFNQPSLSQLSHKTIEIEGNVKLLFRDCYNFEKFRMSHKVTVANTANALITFNNTDVIINDFIKASVFEGAEYNLQRYARINHDGVVYCGKSTVDASASTSPKVILSGLPFTVPSGGVNLVKIEDFSSGTPLKLFIRKLRFSNYGLAGYGNPTATINVYNLGKTSVLASFEFKYEDKVTKEFLIADGLQGYEIEATTTSGFTNAIVPVKMELI